MDNLVVLPGNRYNLNGWLKTQNVMAGIGGGATMCLQWEDADHQWIGGVYPAGITGTNDWTHVTCQGTSPANAAFASITLYLRPQATGTAWFDDVSMTIHESDARNFVFEK